ncbi:BA2291 family sporulation histidine kinase [Bacillus bingmayongensis]|uniref:BA2291 family sporulation histidine kinase n=1 Tax=Bacillus bingmayongensis TaxID=1150157 RepID=UPI0002F65DEC|nr:BA2291 family sporulation histidine kinase [Bacillus bingmayongensis]
MEMEGMGVFPIDKDIKEVFCSHLKNNRHQFVENWKNKMIISEKDPFKQEVARNGEDLLELIIELIMEDKDIAQLQPLCEKIAIERAGADANIGDFVYNANVGRNELFEAMCELDVKARELKSIMTKIHTCFDKLIYYTVLKYSEIISRNLEEKQQYINETHKERLTILGQMSASFVHEFRNPLTSIMGFVKLLKLDHPNLSYLDIISHELDQLNFRISQFLLVSKKEMWNESERFLLNDLFHDIIHFLYPSLVNSNVLIEKNLLCPIPFVGYRSEVRQVFLNILMNSIDALEVIKEDRKIIIDACEGEERIHIVIKNNGPMIPAESIETIFEPFVTTKKLGTGIGLFVCKQIVEKHNGSITCHSNSEWTEFHISFQK